MLMNLPEYEHVSCINFREELCCYCLLHAILCGVKCRTNSVDLALPVNIYL